MAIGLVLIALPGRGFGQERGSTPVPDAAILPDAPQAQFQIAEAGEGLLQESSSSQAPAVESDTSKSQNNKADDRLKIQEHQRVAGVMATFNTTADRNAPPLTSKEKFRLFFRGSIDPWPFALAGAIAGIGQADNNYPEWGQGAQGYAKRYGAAYADTFIGNFFGNAVLPVLLHEDPRYFQKGTGSKKSRFWWAATSTVWCRRDNKTWGSNYANLGGNLIAASISRAYYPDSERTVGDVFTDGLRVSAEGIVGSEIIEFWPDIARHYKRKHDEKMARKAAAQSASQPANETAPAPRKDKPE
jgi:hypothetical protein